MLEEDELRWRSGRLRGRWRERISHLSGVHRRMLHEQPSAAAVVRVAKRGKERDAARAGRGRHVVGVPIDVVNQRRGGLIERALWALVELAERVALAHLERWLLLRPRRSGAPRSHLTPRARRRTRRVKTNDGGRLLQNERSAAHACTCLFLRRLVFCPSVLFDKDLTRRVRAKKYGSYIADGRTCLLVAESLRDVTRRFPQKIARRAQSVQPSEIIADSVAGFLRQFGKWSFRNDNYIKLPHE